MRGMSKGCCRRRGHGRLWPSEGLPPGFSAMLGVWGDRAPKAVGAKHKMPALPWLGHSLLSPPRRTPWHRVTEKLLSYVAFHRRSHKKIMLDNCFVLEASFINHLYQAHICSATVRDGIQRLTSNPTGGTWLRDPAQREEAYGTLWKDNPGATQCSGYVVRRLETSGNKIRNTSKIGADLCFGQ